MKLTILKTRKLTVQGRRYALVGSAGVASRGLSAEQFAMLVTIAATLNASTPRLKPLTVRCGCVLTRASTSSWRSGRDCSLRCKTIPLVQARP